MKTRCSSVACHAESWIIKTLGTWGLWRPPEHGLVTNQSGSSRSWMLSARTWMIAALALTLLFSVACGEENAEAKPKSKTQQQIDAEARKYKAALQKLETETGEAAAKSAAKARVLSRTSEAVGKWLSDDKDQQTAGAKTLRKMAREGHPGAMRWWGHALSRGRGVEKDLSKANHWHTKAFKRYRKMASAGDEYAQYGLGETYEYGYGVKRDFTEAVKWYRKAADAGLPSSQYRLGILYAAGRGVEKDHAEATKWYRKAAAGGSKKAKQKLAELNAEGRETNKARADKRTPEELRRQAGDAVVLIAAINWTRSDPAIQRKSAKTFRQFAERGNVVGMRYWGDALRQGRGVEKDTAEGLKWLRKAAAAGDDKSRDLLAKLGPSERESKEPAANPRGPKPNRADQTRYQVAVRQWEGDGLKKDRESAAKTFQSLAQRGHVGAMGRWGAALRLGQGVDKDVKRSVPWLQRAAAQLDPEALHHLGIMHANGEIVKKNERTAFKYHAWAAKQGHVSAAMYVGMNLASGKGVEQNKKNALRWIIHAANEGDPMAKLILASKKVKLAKVAHVANDRRLPDWVEKAYARAKRNR